MFDQIRDVLEDGGNRAGKIELVAEVIRRAGGYRWVGIYDVKEDEIAALGWSGPGEPSHPRLPRSEGLCGGAVSSGKTIVVGDVSTDPRYLTTFGSTRSEMVVPVPRRRTPGIVGVIDVECERPNAFTEADRTFVEGCATAIAGLWEG